MEYRCSNCNKYLGQIKRLDIWSFTRSKKLEVDGDTLVATCKCGERTEIDLSVYKEQLANQKEIPLKEILAIIDKKKLED